MHQALEEFKKTAEAALQPLIAEAKIYFGDDEAKYFIWLQKASFLKLGKPELPFDQLTPQAMDRPLVEIFRQAAQKSTVQN